jgi:hypothetical protein
MKETRAARLPEWPRSNKPLPAAIFDDAGALPQGDGRVWPALAGGPIGRHRYLEILDAGKVLDDILAISRPHVDAVQEVSSGAHGVSFAAKPSEPRPDKWGAPGRGSQLSGD